MNHNPLRIWLRENPIPTMMIVLTILAATQILVEEHKYESISIAMIFIVFAFKSWVNLIFAVTTHKQHGETPVSIATERYFWALLFQSVSFGILSGVATLDTLGIEWFGYDLIVVRNSLRSIAVISVIAVIIYGDQTLEALREHILHEKDKGHEPHRVNV